MITNRETPANQKKRTQLVAALDELLADVLRPGFHGRASLEIAVQDGTIQHILRKTERLDR